MSRRYVPPPPPRTIADLKKLDTEELFAICRIVVAFRLIDLKPSYIHQTQLVNITEQACRKILSFFGQVETRGKRTMWNTGWYFILPAMHEFLRMPTYVPLESHRTGYCITAPGDAWAALTRDAWFVRRDDGTLRSYGDSATTPFWKEDGAEYITPSLDAFRLWLC